MMPINKVGNTKTINQNIVEPFEAKLDNRYVKKIGTIIKDNKDDDDDMSLSTISVRTKSPPQKTKNYDNEIIKPGNRGKFTREQHSWLNKPSMHDINYLKSLESNLESYLYSLPQFSIQNSEHHSKPPISPKSDDILIDVDIGSFDSRANTNQEGSENFNKKDIKQLNSINNYETKSLYSLSNFHNVRDLILNIQRRLEKYLSSCEKSTKLEMNIEEFLKELDEYVNAINEKKEYELRRFSENMSNQKKILHVSRAFEKRNFQIYDTLESDSVSYYSNDSINGLRRSNHEFMMRNCYDQCSLGKSCSDSNSIEYYSMVVEDRKENLLNDAPPPLYPRYEAVKSSLVFQSPDKIISEWQNWQKYQLEISTIEPKKNKFVKFAKTKKKNKRNDINYLWSFTLDYHRTKSLQLKLEKEKKIRLICRVFFCLLGVISFILIVLFTQSIFNSRRGAHF